MTTASNNASIEDALNDLTIIVIQYKTNNDLRLNASIMGGHALNDLKEVTYHGDFTRMVEQAGLTMRTAQRWMRLADSGLKYDTVAYLGGMNEALAAVKYAEGFIAAARKATIPEDATPWERENLYFPEDENPWENDTPASILNLLPAMHKNEAV